MTAAGPPVFTVTLTEGGGRRLGFGAAGAGSGLFGVSSSGLSRRRTLAIPSSATPAINSISGLIGIVQTPV